MKKNTFYLLAISILLIFSVKSYAQMQSVINTSTHRTITVPLQAEIKPIKSLAIKPTVILSTVKVGNISIAIVGYSAMDQFSGTSISSIDLNTMDVIETQAVDATLELRSNLKDINMDYINNELLCLINNPATGFNDNIFALKPLSGNNYNVPVAIPDGQQGGVNYYEKLVAYEGDLYLYYMALGNDTTTNTIHFFDKKQSDFSDLNCMDYVKFDVNIIEPIEKIEEFEYKDIYEIPFTYIQINSNSFLTNYLIICN